MYRFQNLSMPYSKQEEAQLQKRTMSGARGFATIVLVLAATPELAQAQEAVVDQQDDQVPAGIASSFALPTEELLLRKHDDTIANVLDGLTITPSISLPFNAHPLGGRDTGSLTGGSPTASLSLRYQPVGYWFVQATLFAYLDPKHRAAWNPDFTYSFGYEDWHPYTLSLVYSNYANNRFSPHEGDPVSPVDHGTISLGWKAPLPRSLGRLFLIDQKRTIDCRIGLNVTPRYDRSDGTTGSWKTSANFGCRYPVSQRIYVDVNVFAYGSGQQPWDPDFTYSFGLFDYRSNRFSIQYANYSGNRFPGRTRSPNSGRFIDGGISLSWNHGF